jgi:hypothetical protein
MVLGILALLVGVGSYVSLSSSSPTPDSSSKIPTLTLAYLVVYSPFNGSIHAIVSESRTLLSQQMTNCGVVTHEFNNATKIASCIFPDLASQGLAMINATSYSGITSVIHHMNAYYVDDSRSPPQIALKVGWSGCRNSDYGNGTIPCN